MAIHIPTAADQTVRECLETNRSFAMIAGAGSGKTTSLVTALDEIRKQYGSTLLRNGQRVACITFTNRAVEVIRARLGFDELYHVTTVHSFLWGEIGRFQSDIRDALAKYRIPKMLEKAREDDTGKVTKKAQKARAKVDRLEAELAGLDDVPEFTYDDVAYSNYLNGQLSHDDIIEIAGYLMANRPNFRRLLGVRFPYIFVDEAQDTFIPIVEGLNLVCADENLPLVGYFGDPWQQIYDDRAGEFAPPEGGIKITKVENFRCAPEVITFLNAFRTDVAQVPAGDNRALNGSVEFCLVQAEEPQGHRKRYTDEQIERALVAMDNVVDDWGWSDREDIISLFLVRQMIARRLGFSNLHQLFTGKFASQRAQDDYEAGDHHLLKPFVKAICPIIGAQSSGNEKLIIDTLREHSPTYDPNGSNSDRSLMEMIELSRKHLAELDQLWQAGTTRDIVSFCREKGLVNLSDRLLQHLDREPRSEEFDEDVHAIDKGDWLADEFLRMPTQELSAYCDFILENTPFSTQHGVKGEEYPNVLIVFDDVEAAWTKYNFTKLLTPKTFGEPTEGQLERGRKLAYVCFSRSEINLRVLLFTTNPDAAKAELIERGLLNANQIKKA